MPYPYDLTVHQFSLKLHFFRFALLFIVSVSKDKLNLLVCVWQKWKKKSSVLLHKS